MIGYDMIMILVYYVEIFSGMREILCIKTNEQTNKNKQNDNVQCQNYSPKMFSQPKL